MNRKKLLFTLLACALFGQNLLPAYFVLYKEQYYKLYHNHLHQRPEATLENIVWLERAVEADFCNPLYALAPIKTKKEWAKYRALFMMHLNLKLVEQHLRLAAGFHKQSAYFYNAPWQEQNIDSLNKAETFYRAGLQYWKEALRWSEKAYAPQFRFLIFQELQFWEDELIRIVEHKLNYERIIKRELVRLDKTRKEFEKMGTTY